MKKLIRDIIKLCGYEQPGWGGADISAPISRAGKAGPYVKEYFSSCIPASSIDRPFHCLLSPDHLCIDNRDFWPGRLICQRGFIVFGSEPNGDLIAVEVSSGRVYIVSHEIYYHEGISYRPRRGARRLLPFTPGNIIKTALGRFPSIPAFLKHWKAELVQLHKKERAFLRAAKKNPDATDEFGNPLLTRLIRQGSLKEVKKEIQRGADLEFINGEGRTALGEAVTFGELQIAKCLIKCGADVNARGRNGQTALMVAARYAKLDGMKLLLDSGTDANAKDDEGNNALTHLCVVHGTPKMRQLLKRHMRKKR